jgi:hypothetical protein
VNASVALALESIDNAALPPLLNEPLLAAQEPVYVTPFPSCSTRVAVGVVVGGEDVPPDVVPPPELPDVVPSPELPDVVPPPELPDVVLPPELPDVVPPAELVDPEPDVEEDDCSSTMNVSIRVAHPKAVSAPSVPSQ